MGVCRCICLIVMGLGLGLLRSIFPLCCSFQRTKVRDSAFLFLLPDANARFYSWSIFVMINYSFFHLLEFHEWSIFKLIDLNWIVLYFAQFEQSVLQITTKLPSPCLCWVSTYRIPSFFIQAHFPPDFAISKSAWR